MTVREVVSKVEFYSDAKRRIERDTNYSPSGRERALRNLEDSIKLYRSTAHGELDRAWRGIRKRYSELASQRAEAEHRASSTWDYEKLRYESDIIRAKIESSHELDGVTKLVKDGLASGNKERARAYAEVAPSVIRSNYPTIDGEHLARYAEEKLEDILMTDELRAIRDKEHETVSDAVELYKSTQLVRNFYLPLSAQMWDVDEFAKLMDGITISQSVDVTTLGTTYNLQIEAEAEQAEASLVGE